jgi:hypothetical protein
MIQHPTTRQDTAPEILRLRMFNVLIAHLFSFLADSQAMQMHQIDPSKRITSKSLLECYLPAIKSNVYARPAYSIRFLQDDRVPPHRHYRHRLYESFLLSPRQGNSK